MQSLEDTPNLLVCGRRWGQCLVRKKVKTVYRSLSKPGIILLAPSAPSTPVFNEFNSEMIPLQSITYLEHECGLKFGHGGSCKCRFCDGVEQR